MGINIFIDERWCGDHGIGRVADSLMKHIRFKTLGMAGSPSSPFDAVWFFLRSLSLPKNSVIFSPGYNSPLFFRRPFIFMVHDLNHIDVPENSNVIRRIYYRLILKRACHAATRIITVSEFSKSRISSWSGVALEKVVNVGNGVGGDFSPSGHAYSPGFRYFLIVSNRKPHKNEPLMLRAFCKAEIDKSIHLLITGRASQEISDLICELGISDRVHFTGRVSDCELASLYRGAVALIFVSLYEGFGLPLLEAMACGTPVLTSSSASLPEVAGSAALLVDPTRVNEVAEGMRKLLVDDKLRRELREAGLERSLSFRWEAVSERLAAVFRQVELELNQ